MNKNYLVIFLAITVLLFALACGDNHNTDSEKDSSRRPKSGCSTDTSPVFSSAIPHEVDVALQNGYAGLTPGDQPCFDVFSWKSFVALNWPADTTGNPLPGNFNDNTSSNRVWEYYKDPSLVFQTMEYQLAFSGPNKISQSSKVFYQFAKVNNELIGIPPEILEATGQPLIDKNLNFALYEIKMNPDEIHYIDSNKLNFKEGQEGKKINFPGGNKDSIGAMEIKATWKIMVPGVDDTTKFYCRRATIYVSGSQSANGNALYLTETVGLVGMHILHKTTNFPFWIWTTFEHINNAPQQNNAGQKGNYSFFNAACTSCQANIPPAAPSGGVYLWQATKPYAKTYATANIYGTQAERIDTIYGPTEMVNKIWQGALTKAGSVFANYRLIGSQWSVRRDAPPFDTVAAPNNLANTTLETYLQKSSCTMTCHRFATDAVGAGADFSFLLAHAKSAAMLEMIRKKKK